MKNALKNANKTLALLLLASNVFAATVGLVSMDMTWDANTETDLAGYRVYQSSFPLINVSTKTASLNANVIKYTVSLTTTTTVILKSGATSYFRLTAFDKSNNESGFNVDFSSNQAQIVSFFKRGDINGDEKVDVIDLSILAKDLP